MIQLVMVATKPAGYFDVLLDTARRFGFEAVVLGAGETWRGFGLKLRLLHEHLRSLGDPRRRILFTDAHDVVLVRPAAAVEAAYERLGAPILASGEKYCYPDQWKADFYPPSATPWRFLNSGGLLGECETLLEVFDENAHLYCDTYDDQRWWTDRFLADVVVNKRNRIRVDTRCEVFQCIVHGSDVASLVELGEAIRNRATGTSPAVIHGPGQADLAPILQWLGTCRGTD